MSVGSLTLPGTADVAVLRTDFSDQAAWEALCAALREPSPEGFLANVELVDERSYEGLSKEDVMAAVVEEYSHNIIIVADEAAIRSEDHPLLVIDLLAEPGAELRAVPEAIWVLENNLSISNLDFQDFTEAVDSDGVFRAFG
jgi:hypothetical protein